MAKVRQSKKGHDTAEVDALKEHIEELTNVYKRAIADYRNLEQRVANGQAAAVRFANEVLLEKLLPVVDNLEQAVTNAPAEERQNNWFIGITLVLDQFRQILRQEGVTEIAALGQPFDPKLHEAVDTAAGKPNEVVEMVSKGYFLHSKVLRPARVKVGKEDM